ncbi:MAG: HRDC domain-containing protein [Candidatus Nanopelagicaceae bacterium]
MMQEPTPETPETQVFPLHRPRFEVAPIVENEDQFVEAISELSSGQGPLAVDAERASGYRYFANAYLFQFYRRGSRIFLIDPIPFTNGDDGSIRLIERFNEAFANQEWIIHASTQDLPCIREFGFRPERLFDTELGARLVGLPRVGLGPLTEELLSLSLAKEHSAVDWSQRPLHPEWKNYAALDVDVLPDLRDALDVIAASQGKIELLADEFQSILDSPEPSPRKDPWRRTSGIHHVKGRRGLAVVRELWQERDRIARELDIAPGRFFPDFAISDIAISARNLSPIEFKKGAKELFAASQHFQRHYRRYGREFISHWSEAILRALTLSESELPPLRATSDALPPVKIWKERAPLAYARLTHARFHLAERAGNLRMPVENLISPELVRRVMWASEKEPDRFTDVTKMLREGGAREWQIRESAESIKMALGASEPLAVEESDSPSQE